MKTKPSSKRLQPTEIHPPLSAEKLRWQCNPDTLGVRTTNDVTSTREIFGQERALRALQVGLEMRHPGYNIFVAGLPGTGRTTTITRLLEQFQKKTAALNDHCFVYNFKNPDEPTSISLPAGYGKQLREDMEQFIHDLMRDISSLYKSQRYKRAQKVTLEHFQERQRSVLQNLENSVRKEGFELVQIQIGNVVRPDIVPVLHGKPATMEEVEMAVKKGEVDRRQFEAMMRTLPALEKQMVMVFQELGNIEKGIRQSLKELDDQFILPILNEMVNELKAKYAFSSKLQTYLDNALSNIREHLDRFRKQKTDQQIPGETAEEVPDEFLEFKVNVLIDNSAARHVPIIIETNPKHKNLFGTVEREFEKGGVWRTDFMHIKAGSFLQADGGYLVLNALDTLLEPGVWQSLKRTLRTGRLEIESFEYPFGLAVSNLNPEPIALNVKVIMIGEAEIYQLLYYRDEDFKKIFKIRADFDLEMPKEEKAISHYLQFAKVICDDEKLLPFDSGALAQIIEFGVRLAGNQKKISTRFTTIADVIREANYWAEQGRAKTVSAEHVEKALAERIYRLRLVEDKIQEMILDGTMMIDTTGKVVGQVNGLSVYSMGEYEFGKPSRITARTSLGRSGVINIEREAALSGPIHTKGVAIISSFLRSRFAQNKPLVVDASITFEQSYSGVDGDSASSTEIYAILSGLADVPLRQDIAVTGSVNQHGEIQPIGGVNLKIEGFYEICKARGLTGTQGVIIPFQNLNDLMVREEIYEAVRRKKFHVYAVKTVDEGIEILTGVKAGKLQKDRTFEPGTMNYLADQKLRMYAREWRKFEGSKG